MITKKIKYGLNFPKIVLMGSSSDKGREEIKSSYKLDWSDFHKTMKENHEKWLENHRVGQRMKRDFTNTLDEHYMKFMCDQEFLIGDSYMESINHYADLGNIEWATNKPFDTSVRDTLLVVAKECINNAFYLLSDCIYGTEGYNNCDVSIWKSCALTNFWTHQTGGGLIWGRAEMEKIEKWSETSYPHWNIEEKEKFKKWIKSFKSQKKLVSEMYEEISESEYQRRKRGEKLKRILDEDS